MFILKNNIVSKHIRKSLYLSLIVIVILITFTVTDPGNAHACQAPPEYFRQTWLNFDINTRNMSKVELYFACSNPGGAVGGQPIKREPQPDAYIRVYGSCHPTDCDWGKVGMFKHSSDSKTQVYYANYEHGFAKRDLSISLHEADDSLTIVSHTHFTDGSGRADYTSTQRFFPARDLNFVAKHSGKCLDVDISKSPTAKGTKIQQWDCLGSKQANQLWTLLPMGSGYYQVVARHSYKCLDVDISGSPTAKGTKIQQWDCLGSKQANQLWTLNRVNGYYQVVAKHSGKCLDVDISKSPTAKGTKIQQWDCFGSKQANQLWTLRPVR